MSVKPYTNPSETHALVLLRLPGEKPKQKARMVLDRLLNLSVVYKFHNP